MRAERAESRRRRLAEPARRLARAVGFVVGALGAGLGAVRRVGAGHVRRRGGAAGVGGACCCRRRVIFLFFGVIFVFPEIFAAKPSNNLLASVLLDASVQGHQKNSRRSKMYISAVTVAEFLIVVVIIMSLPKLVTS